MKKLCCNAFCVLPLLGALILPVNAAEFWLVPNGDDRNGGTRESPMASVTLALRKARELRRLHQFPTNDAVRIILRGGNYPLTGPLLVRPEDSGTASSPTLIEAEPGEKPVLSGAFQSSAGARGRKQFPVCCQRSAEKCGSLTRRSLADMFSKFASSG